MDISRLDQKELMLLARLKKCAFRSDEYEYLIANISRLYEKISEVKKKHMAIYDYNYKGIRDKFFLHLVDKFEDNPKMMGYVQKWKNDGLVIDSMNDSLYDVMNDRLHITEEWLLENKDNHKGNGSKLKKTILIFQWLLYDYLYREEDWKSIILLEV